MTDDLVLQAESYKDGSLTLAVGQHSIIRTLRESMEDPAAYEQVATAICDMLQPDPRLRASVSPALHLPIFAEGRLYHFVEPSWGPN